MQLAQHQRRPRLELQLRHHPDHLHALYRESQDQTERARWHALWLLARGQSIPEVARNLGYTDRWVRQVIHRYNQGLPMKNLRHENKGRAPLVPPELQEPFRQALLQPHPRDGLWSIRNAAEWLAERLGRPVDGRRAWYWMRRLGLAPLRPRPRHREADAKRQEGFKKSSF
ncbi:winged helix-turn-helix domain-containing protein [Meiothermus ruber]|uniref:winged helix-turn-helix domain-containing protein n=1 Tax=Meiothermus ruber TaxID=277 RepID=UPI00034AED88|nr:winged helix-turn-helix domain-containing protein [Meiothermus ruber]GAO74712.1 transposase [Meiothermus ruber H328]GAO75550.1 transposase [Meiothermus ruber H328]